MKKRLLFSGLIITILLCVTACNTVMNDVLPDSQVPLEVEGVIAQWSDPALEALVREKLDKPSGDIKLGDLDGIWGIEVFGDTHIYFNADGGFDMYSSIDNYPILESIHNPDNILLSHQEDDLMEFLKDGIYFVDGEQYSRGSISSLADFANFRDLNFLHIYKNSINDLSGLSHLENLTELKLPDNAIQDIAALTELRQITSLILRDNQVDDISALSKLNQLCKLYLRNNNISDPDGLAPLCNLDTLDLSLNPITSIEVIKEMDQLKGLRFAKTAVNDLSPLTGKLSITGLTMSYLQVESIDLAPLATMENIRILFIQQDRAELLNFQALGELKKMWELDIWPNINISEDDLDWLKKELPECDIR